MNLQKILQGHQKYLDNEGGERANLSGANLSEAILRWADLYKADLYKADLSEADLRWAKGIVYIGGFDKRGGTLVCWRKNNLPYFTAGYHRGISMDKALAHWGSAKYPDKKRGQLYVSAAKFLAELGE